MKRVSISFYDEIYKKLEERMQITGSPSIAQCVRELIDLALKIESAAKESHGKSEENNLIHAMTELKNLFKNNLNWSLESRLLTRFLVEHHPSGDRENMIDVLNKYKKTANDYVAGLYGEKIE